MCVFGQHSLALRNRSFTLKVAPGTLVRARVLDIGVLSASSQTRLHWGEASRLRARRPKFRDQFKSSYRRPQLPAGWSCPTQGKDKKPPGCDSYSLWFFSLWSSDLMGARSSGLWWIYGWLLNALKKIVLPYKLLLRRNWLTALWWRATRVSHGCCCVCSCGRWLHRTPHLKEVSSPNTRTQLVQPNPYLL